MTARAVRKGEKTVSEVFDLIRAKSQELELTVIQDALYGGFRVISNGIRKVVVFPEDADIAPWSRTEAFMLNVTREDIDALRDLDGSRSAIIERVLDRGGEA